MSQLNEAATTATPVTPEQSGGQPLLADNGGGNVDATLLGDAGQTSGTGNGAGDQSANKGDTVSDTTTQTANGAPSTETQTGLAPLPDGASEDQKADFNKKLRALNGTPADVEGYGNFGFDEGVIDTNSEDYKYYTKVFHDIGLNKEQAKKLLEAHHKYASEMVEFQKRQNNEVITEYRRKVRNDFVKECGGEEQFKQFNDTAVRGFKAAAQGAQLSQKDMKGMLDVMGDDPRFIRIFNAIGKMHREDVLITGAAPKAQEKSFDDMFSSMFKAANG